ncbi:MAG TPA: MerR family transcriptional regulator [Acidimicrobiales bacterium]|nr:MerR family transcriptional regulator [Acidimicrobiales bacterium]
MAERAHLTIGEVLSLLREEFPDVSISKIRFLESQGLVDPERTPSGYRKFYDHDVARLRWILKQQREHFLPLKVIKDRLEGAGDGLPSDEAEAAPAPTAPASGVATGQAGGTPTAEVAPAPSAQAHRAPRAEPDPAPAAADEEAGPASTPAATTTVEAAGRPTAARPGPVRPEGPDAGAAGGSGAGEGTSPGADRNGPAFPGAPAAPPAGRAATAGRARPGQPDVYTAEELATAAGCDASLVDDLRQYGLLAANATVGGVTYFAPEAVAIARTASRFAAVGVEPRHLRPWRNAADREASLFEQLVMPLLRQRNPQGRHQAAALLDELTQLGADLRAELVREAVRAIH